MEAFFGRLKNEMYYGYEKEYDSFESFSLAVKDYIDYYNNERIQVKTKWMSPVTVSYTHLGRACTATAAETVRRKQFQWK